MDGATAAPKMAKDSNASVHPLLDNVRVKWVKTVFWALKMAALDCAHFSRWGIIDARIFLRFSAMIGLTTYAVKSSIKAKEPLFLLMTSSTKLALKNK